MNNIVARALALVSSVVLGFVIVFGFLLLSKDEGSNNHVPSVNPEDSHSAQTADDSPSSSSTQTTESDEIPDQVSDLNIPSNRFNQKEAITSWVLVLNQNQVGSWLEQSKDPDWEISTFFRTEFQKALVQKLAQKTPEQALEFALERREPLRSTLGAAVFIEWAVRDLHGAIERAKTLDELDRYWVLHSIFQSQESITRAQQQEISLELGDENYYLQFYFQSILANEIDAPEDLWYEIVELATWDNIEHLDVFETIAIACIDKAGLEIFSEIIASITEEDFQGRLAEEVMRLFTQEREQTEEAFEYVLNLVDSFPRKAQLLNVIIGKWASQDPTAILRRSETMSPSSFKEEMLSRGYRERARNEPKHLLENLAEIPLTHREDAAKIAVGTLTRTAPTDATHFVMQLKDDNLQQELAIALVKSWSNYDLAATKNWVLNLASDDALRDVLLAPLADAFVDTDSQFAFQIALQQSLTQWGRNMRGYEVVVLEQIARSDMESAIELLSQVREESKLLAYVQVAEELIGDGDSQGAVQLARELSESDQLEFFQNTVWDWLERDMEGLMSNLEQIESVEARSWVVMFSTGLNKHTKELSDEEIQALQEHLTETHKEMLNNNRFNIQYLR